MSRYTWLLDPGHGGIIDGVYQTSGKKSPTFPNGSILYEGVFNRKIVNEIIFLNDVYPWCDIDDRIKIINIADTNEDVSLRKRVLKANNLNKVHKNCIYISVHANAFGDGNTFNSANGISFFHHINSSKGKILADTLQKQLINLTKLRDRGIKANESWANFYVLRKTNMPAILSENGFMTNLEEARLLSSTDMQKKIAKAHLNMILEIEKNGL